MGEGMAGLQLLVVEGQMVAIDLVGGDERTDTVGAMVFARLVGLFT